MFKKNIIKNKLVSLSVVILVFMVTVIGATYAYFALTESNSSITATTGVTNLSMNVSKILPTSTPSNMIPQKEDALLNAVSSNYNCLDDNGDVVCQVYQVTVYNNANVNVILDGSIIFSDIANMPNLKWKLIDSVTNFGNYSSFRARTSEEFLVENIEILANQSKIFYILFWINEIEGVQTDNGTFRVNINFQQSDLGVTSTLKPNVTLLKDATVGSYVNYVGSGGTVGNTQVQCKTNGDVSSSTENTATESSNSCLGQNAREDLESDSSLLFGAYGYCYNSGYKFTTTGWRVAYIDKTDPSNQKAVLISAGAPECNTRTSSTANVTYIKQANAYALKYCNPDFVDGNCTCEVADDETVTGGCTTPSMDAWAVNDDDFYQMTKAISGYGKRLTASSSTLGDSGGVLGTTLYCSSKKYKECGYGHDLIDNGGYYWFAARNGSTGAYGVSWSPYYRSVSINSIASAYGLRPVIRLSSSVRVTGGTGTFDDPYQISK